MYIIENIKYIYVRKKQLQNDRTHNHQKNYTKMSLGKKDTKISEEDAFPFNIYSMIINGMFITLYLFRKDIIHIHIRLMKNLVCSVNFFNGQKYHTSFWNAP